MKWLLISTIVIILGVGWILAEEPDSDYCSSQEIHQAGVVKKCIDNFVNITELRNDVHERLYEYSGNDAGVIELAEKYCPVSTQIGNCRTLLLNIPEECRNPQFYQWQLLNYRKDGAVIRSLCQNNATVLLELMPNDGFKTIAQISKNNTCANILEDIPMYNELPDSSQIKQTYCDALIGIANCYKTAVEGNENQSLPRLFNNVLAGLLTELECQ